MINYETKNISNNSNSDAQVQDFITKLNSSTYGFTDLPRAENLISKYSALLNKFPNLTDLVVVGIGGSDLGGRTIAQALAPKSNIKVHFIGEWLSEDLVNDLLSNLDLSNTLFNIVSKSGGTTETIYYYQYFKQVVELAGLPIHEHFMFTTDPVNGLLNKEIEKFPQINKIEIPSHIGGRFSVLTNAGLFPAYAMGVNIDQLLLGASSTLAGINLQSWPIELALNLYTLDSEGFFNVILHTYNYKLSEFARWVRQLVAESVGKDGKGILPIYSPGPADQHSQLQFYMQGKNNFHHLFINTELPADVVKLNVSNVVGLEYLSGVSLNKLLNVELTATAQALTEVGKPVSTLNTSTLNAELLGSLFMGFEIATALLGELYQVNAFDQPGVELSKQFIKSKLQG